jgi:hypothetical protein
MFQPELHLNIKLGKCLSPFPFLLFHWSIIVFISNKTPRSSVRPTLLALSTKEYNKESLALWSYSMSVHGITFTIEMIQKVICLLQEGLTCVSHKIVHVHMSDQHKLF